MTPSSRSCNPCGGEVWIVSLEPTQGDEITKIRRCAVVSTDRFSQRVGVLGSELVEDIAATIKPCLF